MASIDSTITWLEQLPEDIREHGIRSMQNAIMDCGNVDTGNMLLSVQGSAGGNSVHIRVHTAYAGFVNEGHGPSVPRVRKTWKKRNVSMLKFKESPKWPGPIYAHSARGYKGSRFATLAYRDLLSYIKSL